MGECEKRKGKPEGVLSGAWERGAENERQLREGQGLRAHPSLAQPAGPPPSQPGDSWAGPPRAAAPPPRPGRCRCGVRCQSGTSGAVFDSLARIATVPPCPIAAQSQDAECDQHGEGKGSRSGRVPDPGPQGKWGGSGLTLHGPPKSWSPAWTGVEGGRARRAAGCCLSSFGLLGQSQGLLASRLQLE